MIRIALGFILTLALAAPALADQRPVWALSTDQITVISVSVTHGLPVATVRDAGMHGHNVYCVSPGAHFGKLTVMHISATGLVLSNGRVLTALNSPTTALATSTGQ
jgi:hypothetical protein